MCGSSGIQVGTCKNLVEPRTEEDQSEIEREAWTQVGGLPTMILATEPETASPQGTSLKSCLALVPSPEVPAKGPVRSHTYLGLLTLVLAVDHAEAHDAVPVPLSTGHRAVIHGL